MCLIAPLWNLKIKNETWIAWYIYFAGILTAFANVYVAGGLLAPGVFWLAILPLVGGLNFGLPGATIGSIITSIYIGFLYIFSQFVVLPNLVEKYSNYQFEKQFNLILFTLVVSYLANYFLRSQRSIQNELIVQKQKFEGLLSILIHDIANPLTAIRSNIKVALREPQQTVQRLEKIENMCLHLVTLIRNIREMKAASENKIEVKLQEFCIRVLILQTLDFFEERALQKRIQFQLDLPLENEVRILVDPIIFKSSILGNLVANAIKFSEAGSEIEIRVLTSGQKIIVEVQDHGIGIPPEMIQKLFLLNENRSRPGTEGEKGTGLGLLQVQQWSAIMSGSVEVISDSSVVRGTTFRLIFPRARFDEVRKPSPKQSA